MKDNANPIIHSVTSSRKKERKELKAFQQWQQQEQEGGGRGLVLKALELSSVSSNPIMNFATTTGGGTSTIMDTDMMSMQQHIKLLQNAGLQFPSTSSSSSTHRNPSFIPSIQHRMQQQDQFQPLTTNSSTSSSIAEQQQQQQPYELVDADEIFDMIRNIQDPEHPLTLEQLNVVNRNHVSVKDSRRRDCCDTTTTGSIAQQQEQQQQPSTVHVRFT